MPYEIDKELDLKPETDKQYLASSAHRGKQQKKSVWTITVPEEVNCFINSDLNEWIDVRCISTPWFCYN